MPWSALPRQSTAAASTPSSARRCRSTGEVNGHRLGPSAPPTPKSQAGAYGPLPTSGRAFISVANRDKRSMIFPARELVRPRIRADGHLRHRRGPQAQRHQTPRSCASSPKAPARNGEKTIVQHIHDGQVDLIVNTPYRHRQAVSTAYEIRTAAVSRSVPCLTTVQGPRRRRPRASTPSTTAESTSAHSKNTRNT